MDFEEKMLGTAALLTLTALNGRHEAVENLLGVIEADENRAEIYKALMFSMMSWLGCVLKEGYFPDVLYEAMVECATDTQKQIFEDVFEAMVQNL